MMPSSLVAVTDTCAIFPQTLRDLLLRAAEAGLYRLRWSEEILDELGRNLREDRGLAEEQTKHLLTEMRRAFPEATVSGYERLVGSMTNHPGDRHVLAAAVQAAAHVIVTDNLKDFPDEALTPFNVEAHPPDVFLEFLLDRHPDQMAQIMIDLNAARRKPSEELSATLDRLANSAPRFVAQLREHLSVKSRLGRGLVQERSREGAGLGEDVSPLVFDAGRAIAEALETIRLGEVVPPYVNDESWAESWARAIAEASEIVRLGGVSPLLVEDRYVDRMKCQALAITEFRVTSSATLHGELLNVAVVDAARCPAFAELLSARRGNSAVHERSRWIIFTNRKCAFLQLGFFHWKLEAGPTAGTVVLEFSGPSDLALALVINRQGRIATTARAPTSVTDVQTDSLVWEFSYNPAVETYLNQMIQQSTQGTVGTT